MTMLFVLVAIGVIAAAAMVAAGRFGDAPDPSPSVRPIGNDPNFDVTFRGYRMDEVDAILAEKDARIAQLSAGHGEH